MKIFASAAQKGGVGKTTTAISVAGVLAARGARVLLVDLDPHTSLSTYCQVFEAQTANTVFALFEAAARQGRVEPRQLVRSTPIEGISLVAGSNALFAVDRRFGNTPGMGLVLQQHLPGLADHFDYCLLDCSPSLGTLLVNALACCDFLLAPVQTEYLAVESALAMTRTLRLVAARQQQSVPYLLVPTMFDRRTRSSHESLRRLRQQHGVRVWSDVIPVDTQFREASRVGQPLTRLRPRSRGAEAYTRLTDFVLAEMEQHYWQEAS